MNLKVWMTNSTNFLPFVTQIFQQGICQATIHYPLFIKPTNDSIVGRPLLIQKKRVDGVDVSFV